MTDEEIDRKFFDLAMNKKLGSADDLFMIDGQEVALSIKLDTTGGSQFATGGKGLICDFFIQGKFSATYTFPYLEYDALKRDVEYHLNPPSSKHQSFFDDVPMSKIFTITPPYTRDDLVHWLMIIELTKDRV